MGSVFVGCVSCSKLLVLAKDLDGQAAARAGWRSTEAGWECPLHTVPLTAGELLAQPVSEPDLAAPTPA